jgi:amino acid adenylation domain-containing protein
MDLTQRLEKLSPQQQKLLALKLEQKNINIDILKLPITRKKQNRDQQRYPLSFQQERLWLIHQLNPDNDAYNITRTAKLTGALDKHILEKSINEIIRRHDTLRTIFTSDKQGPAQVILNELSLPLQTIDLKDFPREKQEQKARQITRDESRYVFDLTTGPLLRTKLLILSDDEHVFLLVIHHIISDGTSIQIFIRELVQLYQSFSQGKPSHLQQLPVQYVDYALWQRQWSRINKKQENFWVDQFKGEIPLLTLPLDYPGPVTRDFEGNTVFFQLDTRETNALKEMALKKGTTLYVVLLAIYNIWLSKLAGQEDIIVGTLAANRRHPDVQKLVGMFVNTLVLRNYPYHEQTFAGFLDQIKTRTLKAFENQEYQYEKLLDNVRVVRDNNRSPLFDVMFMLGNIDFAEINIPGLILKIYEEEKNTAQFDLTLKAWEQEKILFFSFEYRSKLFKETTIQRYTGYFKKIITTVIHHPNREISAIEIISKKEKKQILFEINQTKKTIPKNKNYTKLFENQVSRTPGKIAAVSAERQITYKELNEEADRINHILSRSGVKSGRMTALYLKRSITMLAALIGVLKTGSVYVPIETDYPAARVEYMLENSQARMVITEKEHLELLDQVYHPAPPLKQILCLDRAHRVAKSSQSQTKGRKNQGRNSQPNDLAYIMFTSGTTGKPKGVMTHQAGMLNHLYAKINDLSINAGDIIAQTVTACFVISIWQFLAALLTGGSICIICKEITLDPTRFLRVLQRQQVTVLEIVPSLITTLLEAALQETNKALNRLRWMISTGEPLNVPLVRKWYQHYPGIKLLNAYGCTETSDDIAHYIVNEIPPKTQTTIPIGKPLQNLHIYILDKHLSLCPLGVTGEICAAGIGVSKGYWQDEPKTKQAFIPNPYLDEIKDPAYAALYKTGDLGYFKPDGNIECLGRRDYQVKIRGNRVELGEIQHQLLNHDTIKAAVVIDRQDKTGNKYLCAYIVAAQASAHLPGTGELKEYLARELPDYMIPSFIVHLENIPLTANGKVDKKALPEPEIKPADRYAAPMDSTEEKLVEIWSEVLGIEKHKIDINSNFFHSGGHSLKAILTAAKIHQQLNVKIPLAELFRTPTIKGLSRYIRDTEQEKYKAVEPVEKKEYYTLSSAQKRLHVLQQMDVNSTAYNLTSIVCLEGVLDKTILDVAFHELIKRHESLRTSFKVIKGEAIQTIQDEVEFEIEYDDIQLKGASNRCKWKKEPFGQINTCGGQYPKSQNPRAKSYIYSFIRPFDLSQSPLLRVGLLQHPDDAAARQNENPGTRQLLMIDIHHIISDGYSLQLLVLELMKLYSKEKLPRVRVQYRDYCEWSNQKNQGEHIKNQESYWLKEFTGQIPVLCLPFDFNSPAVADCEGNAITFEIDAEHTKTLRRILSKEGITLSTALLAIYYILLAKYSGQEDIIIGIATVGRTHADLQNTAGMFVNMVPARNQPKENITFADFLTQVKENLLKAYENQDYPYEELIKQLKLPRTPGRDPLIDAAFTLQDFDNKKNHDQVLQISGLKIIPYPYEPANSSFPLDLEPFEEKNTISLRLRYFVNLFKKSTINTIARHFLEVLKQVLENINIKIKDIKISFQLSPSKRDILQKDDKDFNF